MIDKLEIADSVREEMRPFSAQAVVKALDKINELVEAVNKLLPCEHHWKLDKVLGHPVCIKCHVMGV